VRNLHGGTLHLVCVCWEDRGGWEERCSEKKSCMVKRSNDNSYDKAKGARRPFHAVYPPHPHICTSPPLSPPPEKRRGRKLMNMYSKRQPKPALLLL
jgi:hypothetical protein